MAFSAIGGMALAIRLRQRWPNLILNETHPKVFFYWLAGKRYGKDIAVAVDQFVGLSGISNRNLRNEHELDAALSAWATRTGLAEGWADLVRNDDGLLFPAGPVHYLWPGMSDRPEVS
jgi:hypothetical protein